MLLPPEVQNLIDRLNEGGYEAYVVGGAVRSAILGRQINDYDITTSALPQEVMQVFMGEKVFAPGIKHGTVCVEKSGVVYEITTYRTEGEYLDSRHPSSVSFVRSLKEDLKRRDFTVNAICFDGKNYVDLHGGIEDCKNEIIRAIGDPNERFTEDALRILRAVRFSAELSFKVEQNTKTAIFARKRLLNNISAERIREELCKLLLGDGVEYALKEFKEVIFEFIPELSFCNDFYIRKKDLTYTVYEHLAESVINSPKDLPIRLAMLLHDISKPTCHVLGEDGVSHFPSHPESSAAMAENILKRLKFSNAVIKEVVTLVLYHDYLLLNPFNQKQEREYILKSLNKLGREVFLKLIDVHIADNRAKFNDRAMSRIPLLNSVKLLTQELLAEGAVYDISHLKLSGRDIVACGFKGKEVGRALEFLLHEVICGRVKNIKEELLHALNKKTD